MGHLCIKTIERMANLIKMTDIDDSKRAVTVIPGSTHQTILLSLPADDDHAENDGTVPCDLHTCKECLRTVKWINTTRCCWLVRPAMTTVADLASVMCVLCTERPTSVCITIGLEASLKG